MVEHDELIQDLHEDLKEWIITRETDLVDFKLYCNKISEFIKITHSRFSVKTKLFEPPTQYVGGDIAKIVGF